MTITTDLIARLERFSSTAYKDSAGHMTIGYGHLILPNEQDLLHAELSEAEGKTLLTKDIALKADIAPHVSVALNDKEVSALTSLAFNIGMGNFINSSLLKLINKEEDLNSPLVLEQFGKWRMAGGAVSQGLVKRRFVELFVYYKTTLDPINNEAPSIQWKLKAPMPVTDQNWHSLPVSYRQETLSIYTQFIA